MDLVSIIMPVYNVEDFVAEAIDSVISQTYKNIELIIVNDGSQDNSLKICEEYEKEYDNICVYSKENGGLSSARNMGIEKAKGDYLVFLDSDDIISCDMVESLLELIKRTQSSIAVCDLSSNFDKMGDGDSKEMVFTPREALEAILKETYFTTSAGAKIYSKEVFNNIRFPEGRIYEDYATIYLALSKSKRVSYIRKTMYYYRVNMESITHVKFSKKRMQYFDASGEVMAFLHNNYPSLCRNAKNRDTRYAISFYKQMIDSDFSDEEVERFLRKVVKENICHYMFSHYSLLSKTYGLCIVVFHKLLKRINHGRE